VTVHLFVLYGMDFGFLRQIRFAGNGPSNATGMDTNSRNKGTGDENVVEQRDHRESMGDIRRVVQNGTFYEGGNSKEIAIACENTLLPAMQSGMQLATVTRNQDQEPFEVVSHHGMEQFGNMYAVGVVDSLRMLRENSTLNGQLAAGEKINGEPRDMDGSIDDWNTGGNSASKMNHLETTKDQLYTCRKMTLKTIHNPYLDWTDQKRTGRIIVAGKTFKIVVNNAEDLLHHSEAEYGLSDLYICEAESGDPINYQMEFDGGGFTVHQAIQRPIMNRMLWPDEDTLERVIKGTGAEIKQWIEEQVGCEVSLWFIKEGLIPVFKEVQEEQRYEDREFWVRPTGEIFKQEYKD
jgi:hypothetical protein